MNSAIMASVSTMPVTHEQLQRSDSQASTDSSSTSASSRGRTPNRHTDDDDIRRSNINETYPPNDARGMSPRRSAPECGELEQQTRKAVKAHAEQMQKALSDIAESIKMVKEDYEKLEKQNVAMQDYIGNLTRTVGREVPGGRKKSNKKGRS